MLALAVTGTAGADTRWATSDACGVCHRDIYRVWRESRHAEALEQPFFLDTFRETQSSRGPELAALCLGCHAPMAGILGDEKLERKISWEGVTCDYCHGLASVEMTKDGPRARVEISDVKRGPIRGAEPLGHAVAYSELHTQSLVCAPCHEFVNREGVGVLTTYTEWQQSSAAGRGETCQTCHMALTEADVVDPRIQRGTQAMVNLHEMPGAHTIRQLLQALSVSVEPSRAEGHLDLRLTLTNRGAGHAVPTGMPGRRIVLLVDVEGGGETREDRRVYGKQFQDASGHVVSHVADYFAGGVRLESDTRIRPDEVRAESFRFDMPAEASAWINVRLVYEHVPRGERQERERLVFYTDRKFVRPRNAS
jgi:hypothetical protein